MNRNVFTRARCGNEGVPLEGLNEKKVMGLEGKSIRTEGQGAATRQDKHEFMVENDALGDIQRAFLSMRDPYGGAQFFQRQHVHFAPALETNHTRVASAHGNIHRQ